MTGLKQRLDWFHWVSPEARPGSDSSWSVLVEGQDKHPHTRAEIVNRSWQYEGFGGMARVRWLMEEGLWHAGSPLSRE